MNGVIQKMPVLVMNPFNRCNCRCVMCDIWKRDSVEEFSVEQLEAQLASIENLGVEWVVLTGGEPLMHPHLFRFCEPLRARRIRLTLLSSGLLLERYAAEIVKCFDDVIVSLDGPETVHDHIRRVNGGFARLRAGVEKLRRLKPDFPIAARCTVQRDNAACLTETVSTARTIGLNSISFLAADLTSEAFNRIGGNGILQNLAPDLDSLTEQIGNVIASGECGRFVLESPDKLRRIVTHFDRASVAKSGAPVCNAPWVSAVLEADGTVRPCFFHKPVGRVGAGTTLRDVVNGPDAIAFRNTLDVASNPVCQRCVCSLHWKSDTVPIAVVSSDPLLNKPHTGLMAPGNSFPTP
jgi:Fe-coproporphyrin III synthase